MQNHQVKLPWEEGELDVQLSENWHLGGVLAPSNLPALEDVVVATERGLADPIGTARLSKSVNAETKIALVIDDDSCPTPMATIVPAQKKFPRNAEVVVIPNGGRSYPILPQ